MSRPKATVHPLAGAKPSLYWKRYFSYRPYSRESLLSRIATSLAHLPQVPMAGLEQLVYGRAIKNQTLEKSPIFILGHWRSGTTHLHNLLSQDEQFGYLSLGQMVMPGKMFGPTTRFIYKLINRKLPKRRSFDRIKLGIETPQEEEIALANLNPLSYYNCYYYPQSFIEHFQKSVLMENASNVEIENFSKQYIWLMKKLTLANNGKQLLMKNPSSAARIGLLKKIFPNAKFIHIVRNPYHVFPSSLKRLTPMLKGFAWQKWEHLDLDEIVFECYELLMNKYLSDSKSIDSEDLIEIRYEDLVENPLQQLESIYKKCQLTDSEEALVQIRNYTNSIQDYKRNVHKITTAQQEKILDRWGFALKHWGYEMPNDVAVE